MMPCNSCDKPVSVRDQRLATGLLHAMGGKTTDSQFKAVWGALFAMGQAELKDPPNNYDLTGNW